MERRVTVKACDGAEAYAYPHSHGIAWGVNEAATGVNILRGIRRQDGVSVSLGKDFYVTVPSPSMIALGVYEQSDSLRQALAYRDRVSQALIDRNLGDALGVSLPATVTAAHKEDLALASY